MKNDNVPNPATLQTQLLYALEFVYIFWKSIYNIHYNDDSFIYGVCWCYHLPCKIRFEVKGSGRDGKDAAKLIYNNICGDGYDYTANY